MRQLCRRCQGTGRDLGYPMDGYACMRCKGKKVEPQQEPTVKHDDGGPAYPTREVTNWNPAMDGMSLLDAFAMEVLPAVYAEKMSEMKKNDFAPADWRKVVIADECYTMAAAMIAEKRRREGGAS